MKKKRKIIFGLLGSFLLLSSSFTVISLFAKEPVIVKGESLDYSHPEISACTNIYKNGFYTHEITIKLSIYANSGASYVIPYNAEDTGAKTNFDPTLINGSTRIVFDGQVYNQKDEIKVSQTGIHKIKVCDGYKDGDSFVVPKNSDPKEEFYFYVSIKGNKFAENPDFYDFYYAKYNSGEEMARDILHFFNEQENSFSLASSKILDKSLNEIQATAKTAAGLAYASTDLYNAITKKWVYFSLKDFSSTDREQLANDLKVTAEIPDPSNENNKIKIRLMSVEDSEATGEINFSLKERAAFFFDPSGTDFELNNTAFRYNSSSVSNWYLKDMFYGWDSKQVKIGYRYNILDSIKISCSGNRWFTNKNGEYVDLNDFTQLEFEFSTDNPTDFMNRSISSTSNLEYIGRITITSHANLVKKDGVSSVISLSGIPMFIVKRTFMSYNATPVMLEPPITAFSQMVKLTTEDAVNQEVLQYVYDSCEKYVEVSNGGQSYKDYSCFPLYTSNMALNNNLKSTYPGVYNATYACDTFYKNGAATMETLIVIKDENLPKIISKYDILYMPISYKSSFSSRHKEYFKVFDDVDKMSVNYEINYLNGWNDDSETATVEFVATDSSGNVAKQSFVINFYDESKLNWWEKKINPGLYAYKKWFLGIFGLKA